MVVVVEVVAVVVVVVVAAHGGDGMIDLTGLKDNVYITSRCHIIVVATCLAHGSFWSLNIDSVVR